MRHDKFVCRYIIRGQTINFVDCYGDNGEQEHECEADAPPWEEVPATPATEEEVARLWCHEDMNSPTWWTDPAYMAAEGA